MLLIYISANAQVVSTENNGSYSYDTTLKGGYIISFRTDDSLQYLYLRKGNRIINELSSTSKGMLYKNLGYIGADFTNYFVLVHSFGSGNPHYIELIKKTSGKNILKQGSAWIDAEEKSEIILYSDIGVPKEKDKMILLDIKNGKRQDFNFPADIFGEPEILNRIKIARLTDRQLEIRYEVKNIEKTKIYNR